METLRGHWLPEIWCLSTWAFTSLKLTEDLNWTVYTENEMSHLRFCLMNIKEKGQWLTYKLTILHRKKILINECPC